MIKRILVGLGGTACTPVAIRRAVELTQIHAARVTAVTVVDAKRLEQLCEEAADYCRDHGFDPEVEYCKGSPRTELLSKAAEWQADMLALSNSARSLLSRRVFGETALHVIRNAGLPLFLHR